MQTAKIGARRYETILPAGEILPGESFDIGIRVVAPPAGTPRAQAAFYCLPGGQMDLSYYDLGSEGDRRFSFAEAMAQRGFITVLADHPGIGRSTCPRDEYAITPDLIARVHVQVSRMAIEGLQAGTLVPELGALPGLVAIGCGHSMGAIAMLEVQARDALFAGVALLGHGKGGMPGSFPKHVVEAARDLDWLTQNLPEIARERFGAAILDAKKMPKTPPEEGRPSFHSGSADPDGRAALRGAVAPLLTIPGLYSMFAGVSDRSSAEIRVPVLVVTGTDDFADAGEALRDRFCNAADYERFAPEDTGHNLFIFPSRTQSFDHIADWAAVVHAKAAA
ncbi:MAG: alpha/beta hydrolase [Sphingomonadaceae bacterium]|nr:alpha/beta hydrolase [Sphingomonadaceae bacterium]